MLYRATMIGIIAFWMVMMGLLVRLETHPDATDILEVPVSYVMRIIFKHGQQSLLAVRDETKPIGTLSLRPSTSASGQRTLDFSGSLSLQLPLSTRQRYSFNGGINMDGTLQVRSYHVQLTQEPRFQFNVKADAATNRIAYEVRQGDLVTASQSLPMDEKSLGPLLLQALGLPATALPISTGSIAPPVFAARETQVSLQGEQLQVYEVTATEGTAPLLDFYVTQLGQVVMAKTNFGYSLTSEDYQ